VALSTHQHTHDPCRRFTALCLGSLRFLLQAGAAQLPTVAATAAGASARRSLPELSPLSAHLGLQNTGTRLPFSACRQRWTSAAEKL